MRYKVGPEAVIHPTIGLLTNPLVLFAIEYLIVMTLPQLFARDLSPLIEALINALGIITVLAPRIWLTLARRLTEVVRLTTKIVSDLFSAIEAERRATA